MAAMPDTSSGEEPASQNGWLRDFHAGERACLEQCYRAHFDMVDQVVGRIVTGADRETLVHEIFFRLVNEEPLRRGFAGGSFGTWLRVVARNQAIDYARRRRLEIAVSAEGSAADGLASAASGLERQIDVRLTLQRFRQEILPRKWWPVFDARFVEEQDQPTAARALGMRRTTLAYREYRIRKLLRRFMLRGDPT
jgi:RNA polymerase sigma-70 factor (ECF subfamily)